MIKPNKFIKSVGNVLSMTAVIIAATIFGAGAAWEFMVDKHYIKNENE